MPPPNRFIITVVIIMLDLLAMHKYFLNAHVKKGSTAIDFTMGNGYDTLYLCEAVERKDIYMPLTYSNRR